MGDKRKSMGAIFAALLTLTTSGVASAAPMMVARPGLSLAAPSIEQVRLRVRHHAPFRHKRFVRRGHRRGYGGGALIGAFGAIVGAAIANSRRHDGYYEQPAPVYAQPRPQYYYDDPGYAAPEPYYSAPRPVYRPAPQPFVRRDNGDRRPTVARQLGFQPQVARPVLQRPSAPVSPPPARRVEGPRRELGRQQ